MSSDVAELERPIAGLPANWTEINLGDIVSLEYGKSLPNKSRRPGTVPVYGSNGVVGWHDEPLVTTGGIVVGRKGTAGSVTVSADPFWPIDTTYFVKARQTLDWDWLAATLQHARLNELNEATGVPGLNRDKAYRQPILLPPLDEQRRIAEVLRSVDEAIAASQATLQQSELALAALSDELFSSTLSEEDSGWLQHPLENLLDNIIDYRGVPPPKAASGIPLLTAKNVRFGYLDFEPREYIAEEDYDGWMRRGLPRSGDIMFTTEAPLGNVAEFPDIKAALGQRTLTLVPKAGALDAKFLKWLLLSKPAQDLIWSHATGSTAKGIKQRTFRKLQFGFPALEEQKRIAELLEDIGTARDAAKRTSEAYAAMKTHLMSDFLSGRVRVPA